MTKQKVAIITAASRGIGAACAEELAKDGFKLVLMSRSDDIFEIADRLEARPLKGSVSSPTDLSRLAAFTYEKYGRVDAAILNTGHAQKGELLELSDAEWQNGFDLLLMNVIRLVRQLAPIMKLQKSGSIVNISAFGAIEPSPDFPISSVIRSSLSSFTKLFSESMAPFNVRMNSILPGFINSHPTSEENINQIPMLRQGTTSEVAQLASFLVSEKSSFLTGQNIVLDGGMTKSI